MCTRMCTTHTEMAFELIFPFFCCIVLEMPMGKSSSFAFDPDYRLHFSCHFNLGLFFEKFVSA